MNDRIKSMLDDFREAWNRNDAAAVAGFFTDDGSLINPFGERADGRPAIEAMYGQYFREGLLRGTSTTINLLGVRDVESSHALIDAEQTVADAGGNAVLTVHLAALMRREGEGWRFVDARPYPFAQRPA